MERRHRFKRNKRIANFTGMRKTFIFLMVGYVFLVGVKGKLYAQSHDKNASSKPEKEIFLSGESYDGPILYHQGNGDPIHLILVEKAVQKLFLYRYDGQYHLLKSYPCSTGEKHGKKQEENDEKTPEGIYFNVSVYRDSKVTIFGDRAFGLNYPDVFDAISRHTGNGIFIHGSNRNIKPFSTNGCIVLSNVDLADLDSRIELKKTPIIIGEYLPFRLSSSANEIPALIPFFKQAMLPESYINSTYKFQHVTVLKYQEKIVALGGIQLDPDENRMGFSRLYLIQPAKNFLVLLKREWTEF